MSQTRSDPETILKTIQQAEENAKKGKLKIYLGAAPGVGKTYKMLHDAQQLRLKNLDVVVGIAESHQRQDIERMLSNFEIMPLESVTYRDKTYAEFDLDAAVRRAPGLILVDEMAHTNTSGLRHQKRWQDIKELLDNGIDVYTTLNVQHIESLKDDIAQIIQAPVKETVPDFMVESAHAIELIDLPVEELLKRLQDGKIYIPEQANLAATHFFRKGNLFALRELALRVTANCVDTEVLAYRKASGIEAIWPTTNKILVCVGASTHSLQVIRIAKQLASSLQAEWLAVYIDKPQVFGFHQQRNRAIQNLRLAEQLGAVTHIIQGYDVVTELLKFSRTANVTLLLVSKDHKRSWRYLFRRRIADELITHCGEINVYVVGNHEAPNSPPLLVDYGRVAWRHYGFSLVALGLVTGMGVLLSPWLASSVLALGYLLVVMLFAILGQAGPAIFSSCLTVLAYDYFFINPIYSFKVLSPNAMLNLGGMLLVFLTITYWMVLKYREAKIARDLQQQTRASYDFSQKLLKTRGIHAILALGALYIGQALSATVLILMPKKGHLDLQAAFPKSAQLNEKDLGVAQWVYDMLQPAGLGTDTLSSAAALYVPIHNSSQAAIGVLKIQPRQPGLLGPNELRILDAFVNQLAMALEVDYLQEKLRKKQLKQEIDSVKNSLLKTISTQLNYPLKFILDVIGPMFGHQSSAHAVQEVSNELSKVAMINNNILQIIEYETKHIHLEKKSVNLVELIEQTANIIRHSFPHRPIAVHSPAALPALEVDPQRIQEVLLNLLDNSIKYSPPDSAITIHLQLQAKFVLVSVENMGSSIKPSDLSKIFNRFYRKTVSKHQESLGLGLTYCQITIEAHDGQIWAENLPKGGVALRFTLPV